jgi:hypothetical protein
MKGGTHDVLHSTACIGLLIVVWVAICVERNLSSDHLAHWPKCNVTALAHMYRCIVPRLNRTV